MPPTPFESGKAAFGSDVMRWGGSDEEARARIKTLTRVELIRGEVTLELARTWRDFYVRAKAANPRNPSAQGRVELMEHAMRLLEGNE